MCKKKRKKTFHWHCLHHSLQFTIIINMLKLTSLCEYIPNILNIRNTNYILHFTTK